MTEQIPKAHQFMPQDQEAKLIMHQRAIMYASAFNDQVETDIGLPYIKFKVGNKELYGIEFSAAKAVVQVSNIKRPPCVSPAVIGVINYQGKLIGVVDLGKILNVSAAVELNSEMHNIIIVSSKQMLVGVAVGEIVMSDYYNQNSLTDSILSESDIKRGLIKGIDKGNIAIINVDKLFASIELVGGEIS